MAKMTIYVPDDLKRRMDEVEGVNWSPLACRAFEMKLAEIITTRGVKNMQDVVSRLRASQNKSVHETWKRGREDGRKWAMNGAEVDDLKRLEDEDDAYIGSSFEPFDFHGDSAYSPGEKFYFTIRPDENGERGAASDFWSAILGNDAEKVIAQDGYVKSFVEAALEVWEKVKEEL